VLKLWDVFFEYPHLMKVLEITCTSRILLLRESLLNPEHNPLDLLMNVPPMADIAPLTQTIHKLMQQKDSDEPIVLPPHQLLPSPSTPSPTRHQQPPVPHPLTGPYGFVGTTTSAVKPRLDSNANTPSNLFNFNKMKETLNKQGEQWKKKIIDTTNEWKQQQEEWQNQQEARQTSGSFSTNSSGGVVGGQPAHKNAETHPPSQIAFSDPLLHPQTISRNQVHAAWAQQLQSRVLLIQEFLMSVEQNGTATNGANTGGDQSQQQQIMTNGEAETQPSPGKSSPATRSVPHQVWEALADIDRVQREIRNFSNSNR
jgi:hypothetical protein